MDIIDVIDIKAIMEIRAIMAIKDVISIMTIMVIRATMAITSSIIKAVIKLYTIKILRIAINSNYHQHRRATVTLLTIASLGFTQSRTLVGYGTWELYGHSRVSCKFSFSSCYQ